MCAFIGVALMSAPAWGQAGDDSTYVEGNQSSVEGNVAVDPGADPGDPAVEVLGVDTEANSDSLPVTGGDVAAMVAVALVLIVGGTALVVVRRRRLAPAA
jgi:LPXTG-motif cell wall-anchored protein